MTDQLSKLGPILRDGGAAAAAVLALILVIWMKLDSGARPDAFTRTDATQMEARLCERSDELDEKSRERHQLQEKALAALGARFHEHELLKGHPGSEAILAAIQTDLMHIRADLLRIERKLEGD